MTGTPQNKHLEKIEDDQSINGLETIDDTQRNDAGRKWFVSQAIQPVMIMGEYQSTTGRMALNPAFTPGIAFTTASAAASTLTCPAGHRYEVYYASAMNATQASTCTMSANISANAVTMHTSTSAQVPLIMINGGFGGVSTHFSYTSFWLNAADTITLTLNTYAGGNDTEHVFLYKDYVI